MNPRCLAIIEASAWNQGVALMSARLLVFNKSSILIQYGIERYVINTASVYFDVQ